MAAQPKEEKNAALLAEVAKLKAEQEALKAKKAGAKPPPPPAGAVHGAAPSKEAPPLNDMVSMDSFGLGKKGTEKKSVLGGLFGGKKDKGKPPGAPEKPPPPSGPPPPS